MKKTHLSRRAVLRGAGALMALPFLEAMLPTRARGAPPAPPPARRLAVFYVPCGIHMPKWTPSRSGPDWELTPTLASLAPVKGDVLVLTGLQHNPGRPDDNGHHAAGTSAFLSCVKAYKTRGTDIRSGISMDQVAARVLRPHTRLPSLELGNDGGNGIGNCDSGYACAYARNISWAGPTTPMPKETSPREVFDRLFADFDPSATQAQVEKRRAYRRSIIDLVREDAQGLQVRLGMTDRRKMDEYLTSVRELEQRIEAAEPPGSACTPGTRPASAYPDVRERTRAMMDLMTLAFQCDLTRIATFMLGNARSERVYDFLGLSGEHHTYSHHQRDPANYKALATIDTWVVSQYAYLLQKLKAVREVDGTLLDNSLVYFGSEVEDGDSHGHSNMPVLLGGRGGGAVTPGRHVRYGNKPPVANLLISMLGSVGVNLSKFGDDGTGPLPELKV
ncbi:DUF1552 domain-containing protein [Myxococcaceae bacterium GXIMD 01537]